MSHIRRLPSTFTCRWLACIASVYDWGRPYFIAVQCIRLWFENGARRSATTRIGLDVRPLLVTGWSVYTQHTQCGPTLYIWCLDMHTQTQIHAIKRCCPALCRGSLYLQLFTYWCCTTAQPSYTRSFFAGRRRSSLLWTPGLRPLYRSNAPAQVEEGN